MKRLLNAASSRREPRRHPNKHQQRSEATRAKLLQAAQRIFARDGFEAARIEDIAAEAGHSRGAFYANFHTKQDLFLALLEQQVKEHSGKLLSALEACETPEQRLEALREYYAKRIGDRRWVMLTLEFKLFALRHSRLRPKLVEAHRRIRGSKNIEAIRSLLPARAQCELETDGERRAALEGVLNGLVLEQAYDPKRLSEDQAAAILRRIFDALTEYRD
ncbi:MAG TPA: helix-turn-helix domain-containing protein [Bryobacteraceae bacterium]|jgi:AcrR family transcriptional regulator|nr:helix-turn-helix domain-containing protein [Bryobacteraceae bacterium]